MEASETGKPGGTASADYPSYIAGELARARDAPAPAELGTHLANAVAAHGLLLQALTLGTPPGAPDTAKIRAVAAGVRKTEDFRRLLDSGEARSWAERGDVEGFTRALRSRRRDGPETGRTVLEVVREVQQRVRVGTARPEDYARLIAAHRISAREAEPGEGFGGGRQALNLRLDAGELSAESRRVGEDPEFRYLVEHENPANLRFNAQRFNGAGLTRYAARARELRSQAPERKPAPPKVL